MRKFRLTVIVNTKSIQAETEFRPIENIPHTCTSIILNDLLYLFDTLMTIPINPHAYHMFNYSIVLMSKQLTIFCVFFPNLYVTNFGVDPTTSKIRV